MQRTSSEPLATPDEPADQSAPRLGFRTLLHTRGAWGLADQFVVSLGNFLTGLVLVRTLPKEDFGVFFLVFGMLLFLNSLHNSLVTYPLSVRGAASDALDLRHRAGQSILFTLMLALPLSLGVIVIVGLEHRQSLIPWALAAMFLWQIQETLRRAIMAHLRHREALFGDAISYLGQAAIVYVLARRGMLTLEAAFIAIASTSLLALLVQAWQLKPALSLTRPVRPLVGEHWSLGRWMLLTNAITLLTVQAMPWTLGYFHGKGEVAEFGALAQVMGLTNPVMIGITGLIVPTVAAVSARRGASSARHVALTYGLQGAALLLPYYALVLLAPEFALRLFTDKPEYAGLGTHLRLFVLAYILTFPAHVVLSLLNGLGRTRSTFVAQCAFSAATLLLSLPLAAAYGLAGAVWSGVLPALAFVATSVVMLRRATAAPWPNATSSDAVGEPVGGSLAPTPEGAVA